MSAQRKKTTAKSKPTAASAKEAASGPPTVIVPGLSGPDPAILHALQEVRTTAALERLQSTWSSELLSDLDARIRWALDALVDLASELLPAYAEQALAKRYGRASLDQALDGPLDADAASDRWKEALRIALEGDTGQTLVDALDDQAVNTLWLRLLGEARDQRATLKGNQWEAHLTEHLPSLLRTSIATQALAIARRNVDQALESGGTVLEAARRLLLAPEADTTSLVVATHPLALVLQRSLTHAIDRPRDTEIREPGGKRRRLKIRAGVELSSLRAVHRDDVLRSMHKRLREIKSDGAAVLKLHLDLMNQAWETGGELPIFEYRFSDALERQGHARSEARRGFHNETMRDMRERIALLSRYAVQSWMINKDGTLDRVMASTPYWVIQRWQDEAVTQETIDFGEDALYPLIMREHLAPKPVSVLIQPGLWWYETDMSRYRLDVPRGVIELPTHHERDRMALLIASFLAIHVRRNHDKHAGGSVLLKVGTLLDEAGIVGSDEFFSEHGTLAKRRRDYLHELDDNGALPLLRELGAFDVTIRDETDFFATGRGWRERFWNAMLEVAIPNLGIERSSRRGKRPAA